MSSSSGGWEAAMGRLRIVTLTSLVQILVPSLSLTAFSKSTRGVSFHPGKLGLGIGVVLLIASTVMTVLLWGATGVAGGALVFWLFGTTGVVMVASSLRPLAFVKPICVKCRLLPVIVEHEAIHLSGVTGEKAVWASMRLRHSRESLKVDGDRAICSFCPIPKRLSKH